MQKGGLRTKGIQKKSHSGNPLITVITVVYNGETTLEQTIQSVVEQSYENIEYIIIDGSSTDGTLDIIKKYEDKIDYWQSEPDKGIYNAMNKGIQLANGELINMMNSGDLLKENIVATIVKTHLMNPDAVLYGMYEIKNNGKYSGCGPQGLFPIVMACHQTVFVPTKYHKQFGLYDEKYKIISDYKFLHEIYNAGCPFLFLDAIIAIYDDTGVSSNYLKLQKEVIKLRKEWKEKKSSYFTYFVICFKYYLKKLLGLK